MPSDPYDLQDFFPEYPDEEMEETEDPHIVQDPISNDLRMPDVVALGRAHSKSKQATRLLDGGTGNIGRSVTIIDDGTGKTVDVLNLAGSDERAEDITIAFFGANFPPAGLGNPVFDVIAVIDFGSGGIRSTVEIDYGPGQILTIPGSSVRVGVKISHLSGALGTTFNVGAFASYKPFSRGTPTPLQRSFFIGGIGIGATVGPLAIPNFATGAKLVRRPMATTDGKIVAVDNGTGAIYDASFVAGQDCPVLPLVNPAVGVSFTNGAAATTGGRMVFEIEI